MFSFLSLSGSGSTLPDPDPLVRGMDPDLDPDPNPNPSMRLLQKSESVCRGPGAQKYQFKPSECSRGHEVQVEAIGC